MSVLYLCDGKRCASCSEECKHTSQIEHAMNFKEDASGNYWEDALPSAEAVEGWIPLSYDDYGLVTDFPHERDGEWVIVTDGKNISVERIKKDAYDHFYPNGKWFELEDVIAWMPLPKPYRERREE